MNSFALIAGALQRLPASARRTLYSIVSLAGLALAVVQLLGWEDLGPITVSRALQLYALLSPAVGVVAVANVSSPTSGGEGFDQGFDEELDFSSFVPAAQDDSSF